MPAGHGLYPSNTLQGEGKRLNAWLCTSQQETAAHQHGAAHCHPFSIRVLYPAMLHRAVTQLQA